MSKKSDESKKKSFKGNTKREGEGSLYDKIMRENLLELFLPLIAEELNFTLKKVTPLPDKQPTTILRETDAFLLIETFDEKEPKFILHLEFESKDDEEMIYRVMEYHGIELRKYRLPIKHVVVYLGEGQPKMRTKLHQHEIFEGFILVNTNRFSPEKWLEQDEPSKIIMAVLGDYQKKNATIILRSIITKLRKVCQTEAELKKFIEQLIIISRMRSLEALTIKITKAMPITIDIEKDHLYKLGLKKADELVKKAQDVATQAKKQAKKHLEKLAKEKAMFAKEKARLEAQAIKALKEKERLAAKVAKEKGVMEAQAVKAAKEKARLEAQTIKALKEKERLAEKAAKEKAAMEAKIKAEKKAVIQRMQAKNIFSKEEIRELLSLEEATFNLYLKEIENENIK